MKEYLLKGGKVELLYPTAFVISKTGEKRVYVKLEKIENKIYNCS